MELKMKIETLKSIHMQGLCYLSCTVQRHITLSLRDLCSTYFFKVHFKLTHNNCTCWCDMTFDTRNQSIHCALCTQHSKCTSRLRHLNIHARQYGGDHGSSREERRVAAPQTATMSHTELCRKFCERRISGEKYSEDLDCHHAASARE